MSDTAPPSAQPIPAQPASVPALSGIGGWLVLPMLGLIGSILSQLANLPDMFRAFGELPAMTDGGRANLISGDLILVLLLSIVAPAILLVLMFNKSRKFPRWYIIWTVAAAAFGLADLMLGYSLTHESMEESGVGFFNYDSLRVILGGLIGVCVWIPYMLNSVRVKNTFVK